MSENFPKLENVDEGQNGPDDGGWSKIVDGEKILEMDSRDGESTKYGTVAEGTESGVSEPEEAEADRILAEAGYDKNGQSITDSELYSVNSFSPEPVPDPDDEKMLKEIDVSSLQEETREAAIQILNAKSLDEIENMDMAYLAIQQLLDQGRVLESKKLQQCLENLE